MQDVTFGLRLYNEMLAAADDPVKLHTVSKTIDVKAQNAPTYAVLSRMLVPSVARAVDMTLSTEAMLRLTRIALAAERYRLDHGRFPAQLTELAPRYLEELPVDPFDLQPMRYKPTTEGMIVYSIWRDRIDNAGQSWPINKKSDNGDAIFRLFSPEHRRKPPLPTTSQPETSPATGRASRFN
jgi:hypothetical protein